MEPWRYQRTGRNPRHGPGGPEREQAEPDQRGECAGVVRLVEPAPMKLRTEARMPLHHFGRIHAPADVLHPRDPIPQGVAGGLDVVDHYRSRRERHVRSGFHRAPAEVNVLAEWAGERLVETGHAFENVTPVS